MFTGYVTTLLGEYAKDPANSWQAKDCAIYLVVALTVRGKTSASGATTTNQLVSIGDFFSSQVCPRARLRKPHFYPSLLLAYDLIIARRLLSIGYAKLAQLKSQAETNVQENFLGCSSCDIPWVYHLFAIIGLGYFEWVIRQEVTVIRSTGHVLPELQATDVNSLPFLKADALKFFTTFRNQIPKETVIPLFPNIINFLWAESNVVHSYAAICFERLLALKPSVNQGSELNMMQSGCSVKSIAWQGRLTILTLLWSDLGHVSIGWRQAAVCPGRPKPCAGQAHGGPLWRPPTPRLGGERVHHEVHHARGELHGQGRRPYGTCRPGKASGDTPQGLQQPHAAGLQPLPLRGRGGAH
eukprot:scaffold97281_cov36-Prasinocladus_malaysianus.AAC.1